MQPQQKWLLLVAACHLLLLLYPLNSCCQEQQGDPEASGAISSERAADGRHPSVLCIGVAKCGTSDLFHSLYDLLPNRFNWPYKKELNLLARPDLLESDEVWQQYSHALNASGPNDLTLDFSPHYFWSATALWNAKKLKPNGGKTIVMLRDPVTMVLSYLNYRKGREGRGLEDGILLTEMDATEVLLVELELLQRPRFMDMLLEATSIEAAAGFHLFQKLSNLLDAEIVRVFGDKFSNNGQGYLLPGLYLPPLRLWADEFFKLSGDGQRSALIIFSDAYYGDRRKVFRDSIVPFIFDGPQSLDEAVLETIAAREEPINKMKYKKHVQPSLHCALHSFFQPFNCRLAKFLHENAHVVQVFPPERTEQLSGGCNLWSQTDIASACGLPTYSSLVRARMRIAS